MSPKIWTMSFLLLQYYFLLLIKQTPGGWSRCYTPVKLQLRSPQVGKWIIAVLNQKPVWGCMVRGLNLTDPSVARVSLQIVWHSWNFECLASNPPAFLQTFSWLAQFVRGCFSRSTVCWSSVKLSFSFPAIWPLGMRVLGTGAEMGPWMQHGGESAAVVCRRSCQ